MKHQPFMQITLSTRPLGLEEGSKGRNVTCQYVMVRRKKAFLKSTQKKEPSNGVQKSETDGVSQKHAADEQKSKSAENVKDTGEKRKIGSSQVSCPDFTRGGKKRKK